MGRELLSMAEFDGPVLAIDSVMKFPEGDWKDGVWEEVFYHPWDTEKYAFSKLILKAWIHVGFFGWLI